MTDELADLRERVAALEAKLSGSATVEHLVAGRVDVVEPDGTLRVSLSNAKQSADAILDGEVVGPGRDRPGVLFFNEQGDECGGISYDGRRTSDGGVEAGASITMDRFGNDQILALLYQDGPEGHSAVLQIVDRPEMSLPAAIRRAREIEAMPEGEQRIEASSDFYAEVPFGAMRLLLGLLPGGNAVLQLCDGKSRPRLEFSVTKDGGASISVLDESGEVEREL